MREQGYISENERINAEKENLTFKPLQNPLNAPHFVWYVKDLLVKNMALLWSNGEDWRLRLL